VVEHMEHAVAWDGSLRLRSVSATRSRIAKSRRMSGDEPTSPPKIGAFESVTGTFVLRGSCGSPRGAVWPACPSSPDLALGRCCTASCRRTSRRSSPTSASTMKRPCRATSRTPSGLSWAAVFIREASCGATATRAARTCW
jgi:hypothetical protein